MNSSIGSNLPRIKVLNQFAIKEVIYKFGPVSRLEIAERLGLTLPTITTSVSTMIKKGLLVEVDNNSGVKTLGRKTMLVDINRDYARYIGIEIRSSGRRAVLTDIKGEMIESVADESQVFEYVDALKSASSLFSSLLDKAGLTCDDIESVGLTIPGLVDSENGMLMIHPGTKWKEKNLVSDFISLTGYKGRVFVENNTIARAFSASMFNGKLLGGADSMAYMFVSIGIGCPLLSDIRAHFGRVTGEGEVGHMIMNPRGPKCACGNHGCLEAYSSERAMEAEAVEAAERGDSPALAEVLKKNGKIKLDDILSASSNGDKKASSIINRAIEYLGLSIANIDNFVRPECIVIEARIFDDMDHRKKLLEVIHKNLYRGTMSDSSFYFLGRDEYSGAKGAVATAIRHDLEIFVE